jgi:hypothetical protein
VVPLLKAVVVVTFELFTLKGKLALYMPEPAAVFVPFILHMIVSPTRDQ